MGPADEFRPLGYDAAKPGGTFVKIGVGTLTRIDEMPYDAYRPYPIADHGKWSVRRKDESVEIAQILPTNRPATATSTARRSAP